MYQKEIDSFLDNNKTRLKELREINGFSLNKVSRDTGIIKETYIRMEKEPVGKTTVQNYLKLAVYYGVSLDYLLGFNSEPALVTDFITSKQTDEVERLKKFMATLDEKEEELLVDINDLEVFSILKITGLQQQNLKSSYESTARILIKEQLNKVYPYNLLKAAIGDKAFYKDVRSYEAIVDEIEDLLVRFLGPREYTLIKSRYLNGSSLTEIGKSFNLTRESARQIEKRALKKLSVVLTHSVYLYHPLKQRKEEELNFLEKRIEGKKEELLELEKQLKNKKEGVVPTPKDAKLLIPIEELNLSNRAYKCLKKESIHNVEDILNLIQSTKILMIRSLGKISINKIIDRLEEQEILKHNLEHDFVKYQERVYYYAPIAARLLT